MENKHTFTLNSDGTLVAHTSDASYACGIVPSHTGPPGTSLKYMYLDNVHNLHVVYTDGRTSNLGYIRGPVGPTSTGPPGPSIESVSITPRGQLMVRDTAGEVFTTDQSVFGHTGPRGPAGPPGAATMTGCTGPQGPGFSDAYIDDNTGDLMMALDTGAVLNAGNVRGPTGTCIATARVHDSRLVLNLTDGTKMDVGHVCGPRGTGIVKCELTHDGQLLTHFSDGRIERSGTLENFSTGPTGPALTGPAGVGIASIAVESDGTLSINYTNGTQQVAGRITGPQGPQGMRGPPGPPGKPLCIETVALAYTEQAGAPPKPAVQNLLGRYPINHISACTSNFANVDSSTNTFSVEKGKYIVNWYLAFAGLKNPRICTALRDAHTRHVLAHANSTGFTGQFDVQNCSTLELVYYIDTCGEIASMSLGTEPCAHMLQVDHEVYGTLSLTRVDF